MQANCSRGDLTYGELYAGLFGLPFVDEELEEVEGAPPEVRGFNLEDIPWFTEERWSVGASRANECVYKVVAVLAFERTKRVDEREL